MSFFRSLALSIVPCALLFTSAVPAQADAIFNFDSVTAGTVAPLTTTVNGLTASVSGPVSVCSTSGLGLATFSGNALLQGVCTPGQLGAVNVAFSSSVTSVFLNFATGSRPSGTLTLQAFLGSTLVASTTANSSVPPGNFPNGEGTISLSGNFDNLVLSTAFTLGLDNINVTTASTPTVPEPAAMSMVAAGAALLGGLALRNRRRSA
jgi:hypothetical protein